MKVTAVFFNKQKTSTNYEREKILNDLNKLQNFKSNKSQNNKLKNNKSQNNKSQNNKNNNLQRSNIFKTSYKKEKNNLKDVLKIFKYVDYKMCIYFCVLLYFSSTILTNFGFDLDSNLLSLATNVYQKEDIKLDYTSIKNIYPVFNETSYNITESIIEKVEEIETEEDSNQDIKVNEEIKEIASDLDETSNVFNSDEEITVVETEMSNRIEIQINDITINNYSSHFDVDYEELAEKEIYFTKESDSILFYSTHTSESYTNSDGYQFEYSGTFRSQDASYNMISVGKLLTSYLDEFNIDSIYNDTPHDYTNYTTSYTSSRTTLKNVLADKDYSLIVDLHRDAIADLTYSPEVEIAGETVSQLMFVVGVGSEAYPNPYAEENLALAIKLQLLAEKLYPGLFRPIMIKDSTYNQDMNNNALLIECGATGNTLEEVYISMECLSNLFNLMYLN